MKNNDKKVKQVEKPLNEISVGIGQRIANRRKQLRLTQEQTSELAGVSHPGQELPDFSLVLNVVQKIFVLRML